jgi:hypothetical protein
MNCLGPVSLTYRSEPTRNAPIFVNVSLGDCHCLSRLTPSCELFIL